MNQTGQPISDCGRAVAAILSNKSSIEEVKTPELNYALNFLVSNIDPNKKKLGPINKLNILAAFWTNNPLMGKNPTSLLEYQAVLNNLLKPNVPTKAGYCQLCGSSGVYSDTGRSWMPLAGGINSDPCSLPNLQGKYLCADCFRSVVILPLGCRFCKAGPYIFHLTEPELQVEAMRDGVKSIRNAILTKQIGNVNLKEATRLSGRLELLEIIAGSGLWDSSRGGKLSRRAANGATIISFSNSGNTPAWNQLHLPAQALDFFLELSEANLTEVFLKWAIECGPKEIASKGTKNKVPNDIFQKLCDDLEERRSVAFVVFRIVQRRADSKLTYKEKQVLEIYEKTAISRTERFDALERIALRVRGMEEQYRVSFLKQLSNIRDRDTLLELLTKYAKSEKTKDEMRFTPSDYRIVYNSSATEIACLLYLLCVAVGEE